MLLDTLQHAVQASSTCAASCPAPGKAFRAEDADALARVICCRRSVFPKHFSGAPIDRLVPLNAAQPEPLSPALGSLLLVSGSSNAWTATFSLDVLALGNRSIVEAMLEAANWAPTHGRTEPWRFVVLGRQAQEDMIDLTLKVCRRTQGPTHSACFGVRSCTCFCRLHSPST